MNTERLHKIAYIIFIALGAPAICYLGLKYVFPILIPFLIAWGIALAVRKPAAAISRFVGISEKICRPIITLLFVSILFLLMGIIVFGISREVWQIITEFGEGNEFKSFIDSFLTSGGILEDLVGKFGEGIADALFSIVTSALSGLFNVLTSFAAVLPGAVLAVVVTVISAIYFSVDLEKVNTAVLSLFPKNKREDVLKIKNGFVSVGVKYMWSYFLLFAITFITVLIGFLILKVRYSLLLALLLAFFDLLPVIGVGTFLIPYGIFETVRGNTVQGVGILVLFAVQTLVRELSEPRILGKNLGVHPILTLVILYSGYAIFGFVGIICVPIFTVLAELILAKKNSSDVEREIGREG